MGTYPYEFSTDVSANTTQSNPTETTRNVNLGGTVIEVVIGWPDGADNQVGVQFRTRSGERIIPRNGEDNYVAANDFTHAFTVDFEIAEDDDLVAEFINLDPSNPHFINVIATIREE